MSTASSFAEIKTGAKRSPLRASGLALAVLSFQTLGIIYSDIGTSPLYVLNGIWSASGTVPPKEDIIGAISAIVWSLTLIPLCKYVFICLHFGTYEGGTFALFQGIYPPKFFESTPTHDSMMAGKKKRRDIKPPMSLRWPFLIWSLFGTSLTMADGVLTAAVSVTSAVGGIAVAKPSVSHDVVSISIVRLIRYHTAFRVSPHIRHSCPTLPSQPLGTARLSLAFAPITFVWMLILASTGIYNITKFPGIFRAFDPSRAIMYFVRTKNYDTLSGVLLAVTGCEALFANLGQFNMLSIQVHSFGSFVYPSLILAYLGQGARLVVNGADVLPNLFYLTIPGKQNGPLFWIVYQLVNMRSLPSLHMVHTSDKVQGQIYIPVVNWILMIATIVIVAAFKNATQLTNAYGFAVATHLPFIFGAVFLIFFGFLDGLFWGASLKKVPSGAWVPLTIGTILLIFMAFWTWAKGLEDRFDSKSRRRLDGAIFVESEKREEKREESAVNQVSGFDMNTTLYYVTPPPPGSQGELEERHALARLPIFAVFHGIAHERGVPPSFTGFLRQWPALPRLGIFLTVSVLPVAHVDGADRYVISRVDSLPGFYGCLAIVTKIGELETRLNPAGAHLIVAQLVDQSSRPTHVVPHYAVRSKGVKMRRITPIVNYIRRILIEEIYSRLSIMFPDSQGWVARADEIVHIGVTANI
ncbi:potassium transporter [Multifurca ochricompacta]|uniref:Potassium transporter n=1 Tax=Multifurca ochricompacta TaxID=376703 RepID=A0AAD4QJ72_9AGAM|nr:potassium transporter [Multifurca ochricompacta]